MNATLQLLKTDKISGILLNIKWEISYKWVVYTWSKGGGRSREVNFPKWNNGEKDKKLALTIEVLKTLQKQNHLVYA